MNVDLKLSVIIPCFNGGATLATQLEALSMQTWSEAWEIIVSNNGSTDNSVDVAKQYENRFPYFQIIDASDRRGGPYAINQGARAARSKNLACCDADDEVQPGWVAAIGNALSEHDVVCGKFSFDKFNEPRIAERSAVAWKDGLYKGRFLPGGGSGNLGIKKWIHEAIGGFDECLPHAYDADYYWRLQLEGFSLYFEPKAIIQIRVGRVNPTLSSLYRRSKNRFASNYWCYKRYKNFGMLPPSSLHGSFSKWINTLRKGVWIQNQSLPQKDLWRQSLAQQTGELMGQLKGRLMNPCKSYQPGRIQLYSKG
ncbi:MAG: glycosyltransferase family A protein [Nitrospirales bacterium]|nr:glycosyltransferase family 2 protein [Nitrospirales bacterium]